MDFHLLNFDHIFFSIKVNLAKFDFYFFDKLLSWGRIMKFPSAATLAFLSLSATDSVSANPDEAPLAYLNQLAECVSSQAAEAVDEFEGRFVQRQVGTQVYKVIVIGTFKDGHPVEGQRFVEIFRFSAALLGTDTGYGYGTKSPDYYFYDSEGPTDQYTENSEPLITEARDQLCPASS